MYKADKYDFYGTILLTETILLGFILPISKRSSLSSVFYVMHLSLFTSIRHILFGLNIPIITESCMIYIMHFHLCVIFSMLKC